MDRRRGLNTIAWNYELDDDAAFVFVLNIAGAAR